MSCEGGGLRPDPSIFAIANVTTFGGAYSLADAKFGADRHDRCKRKCG